MRTLLSVLSMLLAFACTLTFCSFTHATAGRGRTELRVGLIDPWLVRSNAGGKVTTTTNPLAWSALAGAGAVILFVGGRIARRRRPEPPDDPAVPEPPDEHTPIG